MNKVVLLDLDNNPVTASLLRGILTHYSTVYLFNCRGTFEFALQDMTEFSAWVSSGEIIILDIVPAAKKEYEYAMLVGQLLALLEPKTHIEVISASRTCGMLMLMLQTSQLSVSLIQIEKSHLNTAQKKSNLKYKLPSIESIQQSDDLKLVKHYCDLLDKMSGKPNTVTKLKNSIANSLQLDSYKAQNIVGMLINLKIVKRDHEIIVFRKKVLKQWINLNLDLNEDIVEQVTLLNLQDVVNQMKTLEQSFETQQQLESEDELLKNFEIIDPVQIEVARKLRELKSNKPKDIYALRDLLEQMFPKSDVRLLLKELLEKGYIHWNGHEVLYSHELFLN